MPKLSCSRRRAEPCWTVPHIACRSDPASFHFRIAGTSDRQNPTLGRRRLGMHRFHIFRLSKGQKTGSSDEKAGAEGSRSPTAWHYNGASSTRLSPTSQREENDQRGTSINLPRRYHY